MAKEDIIRNWMLHLTFVVDTGRLNKPSKTCITNFNEIVQSCLAEVQNVED